MLIGSEGSEKQSTSEDLFVEIFGAKSETAREIAMCESSMNPEAISDTNDWGLMQINQIHSSVLQSKYGWTLTDMLDPYKNLVFAKYLHDRAGGFDDWFMSNHCHQNKNK